MSPRASASTKARILETALKVFARTGYAAASLREIAAPLEISKAALYYHFGSKDELLVAVTEPLFASEESVIRSGMGGDSSPEEMLTRLLDELLRLQPIVRLVAMDLAVASHPEIKARTQRQNRELRRVLSGETGSEGQLRASAALGAIHRPVLLMPKEARIHRRVIIDAAMAALHSGDRL